MSPINERIVAAFVPLVDAAVLVVAREQGFAAEAGIDLVLVKEPSWASLRATCVSATSTALMLWRRCPSR